MKPEVVVYVEYPSCEGLDGKVMLRCTTGNKGEAYRKMGLLDDDADFAWRFLSACERTNAELCVAMVKDPDVDRWISILMKFFKDVEGKVVVLRIPFTFGEAQIEALKEFLKRGRRSLGELMTLVDLLGGQLVRNWCSAFPLEAYVR